MSLSRVSYEKSAPIYPYTSISNVSDLDKVNPAGETRTPNMEAKV